MIWSDITLVKIWNGGDMAIVIFKTIFGSKLYGTDTPFSDTDWKGVYLPDARDIIMEQIKPVVSTTSDNVDEEYFSLKKYLSLVAQGQTVAMDMLFATPFLIDKGLNPVVGPGYAGNNYGFMNDVWMELWDNRSKLLSSQCRSFIGYARKQANKYGIKGSRMGDTQVLVTFLKKEVVKNPKAKLASLDGRLNILSLNHENISLEDIASGSSGSIKHLVCCDKKAPYTVTIDEALKIYEALLARYGQRAEEAKNNDNVDWKALGHAVRICEQSIIFLQTGEIHFPNKNRKHYLSIRNGEISFEEVSKEIEELFNNVQMASDKSFLPTEPDYKWIDSFVERVYSGIVVQGYGGKK